MKYPIVILILLIAGFALVRFIPRKPPPGLVTVTQANRGAQQSFDGGVIIGFQVGAEFVRSNIPVDSKLSNLFVRAYDLAGPAYDPRIVERSK